MSGAINYALSRICGRGAIDIPREILRVGFRDDWLDNRSPITLEQKILNWVIKERVIPDMDLEHCEQIQVDLSRVPAPYTADGYSRIYNIPPEMTGNREILCVTSVSYVPYGNMTGHSGGTQLAQVPMVANDIMTAATQVMNSVSSVPNISTARVDLVGYNVVRVTDRQRLQSGYVLRCQVTNDSYLSNIVPGAYPDFANLCILATKAFLYNKMIVMMGDHHLQRGQELGIFKEIVSQYSEAAQEYRTFLRETWSVVAFTMDEDDHTRFLSMQIPLGL